MKLFQIAVIILLVLNLGATILVFYMINNANQSFAPAPKVHSDDSPNNPFKIHPWPYANLTGLLKINNYRVDLNYPTEGEILLDVDANKTCYYAAHVPYAELPAVLEILNSGHSYYDPNKQRIILDSKVK